MIDPAFPGLTKTTLTGSAIACATCAAGEGVEGAFAFPAEVAGLAATKVLVGKTVGASAWMSGAKAGAGCDGIALVKGTDGLVDASAPLDRAGDVLARKGAMETSGAVGEAVLVFCNGGTERGGPAGLCAA